MAYSKLVLFDIDGTLVSKSTGHVEAFAVAFYQVYKQYASIYMIKHQGMTDRQIIRGVLRQRGLQNSEIDAGMEECLQVMAEYFSSVQKSITIALLPGVERFLQSLQDGGCLLGLVTGNLESIAHGKLSHAGIDHYFSLGGFGSDAEDRSDLVAAAIQRATEKFGFDKQGKVFLFGDAPQDMRAAAAHNVYNIGVTTGIYNEDELRQADARDVVSELGQATRLIV